MKGPIVFLLSFAGVAAAAFVLVLPVARERGELADRLIRQAATTDPEPTEPGELPRLATALGLSRVEGEPGAVARSLALDFAPMNRISVEDRRVSFPAAWADVPRLLGALASRRGLVFTDFRVEPGEPGERCRVTLEFAAPPSGFGVR